MQSNRDKLLKLRSDYQLTWIKISQLLAVPQSTLNNWVAQPGQSNSRPTPDWAILALRNAIKVKKLKRA